MNIFCLICCEPHLKSEDIVSTPCGHVFHRNCIKHWFRIRKSCPKCRAAINTQNFIQLFFDIDENKGEFQKDIEQHKKVIADLKTELRENIEINKSYMDHMLCNEEQIKSMRVVITDLKTELTNYIEMNKMHMMYMKSSERRVNSLKEENSNQREQIMDLKEKLRILQESNKKLKQKKQNAFRIIGNLEGKMKGQQGKITKCELKIEKNKLNDNANNCQNETEISTIAKVEHNSQQKIANFSQGLKTGVENNNRLKHQGQTKPVTIATSTISSTSSVHVSNVSQGSIPQREKKKNTC
ncbi:CLUMA_CG004074, isoform A [Clunio marinus]|uniref:CLUMA_CG004074, isoform A n=1 Tax=Clunio marinus TaxID=568069 RepID=A0A1J1HQP1_9DIPT|nr:CLUMA_CG004074, isoform A [Clunio marinus]